MKKLTLIIVLLLVSLNVYAKEIGFLTPSYHIGKNDSISNHTGGYYVENKNFVFSNFINSFGNESQFLGYSLKLNLYKDYINFKLITGIVYGYGVDNDGNIYGNSKLFGKKPLPYIVPNINFNFKHIQFNVILVYDALTSSIGLKF